MTVLYHPDFAKDIRKFEAQYLEISTGLAERFPPGGVCRLRRDQAAPEAAGHFLQTGSRVIHEFRRRNLHAFFAGRRRILRRKKAQTSKKSAGVRRLRLVAAAMMADVKRVSSPA